MEVSENGDIANWKIQENGQRNGAMDLVLRQKILL
jgi:acyl CoA:acetate/3-ketoacid CoA transferase beta subunit